MPGTTADNPNWVRRKINTVQRLLKSSYRVALEQNRENRLFAPNRALDGADFVLAGGAFPIRMKGFGPIGCVTISGLHERDDHQVGVDAVAEELSGSTRRLSRSPSSSWRGAARTRLDTAGELPQLLPGCGARE